MAKPKGRDLRYLRRRGNRRVRAQRRRRTALRLTLTGAAWIAAAVAAVAATGWGARWVTSPQRFRLERVEVKGAVEARPEEISALLTDWMGHNIFNIVLTQVEAKVREHRWIGPSGGVRIQRRLPGTLVVTVIERRAGGLALVNGALWLIDEAGRPIDRHGPRYARHDFPVIKGLNVPERMADAVAAGVGVARSLASSHPAFYGRVSEIDMSEERMVVLRLEGEAYDLRLSRGDYLQNLDRWFALKDEIGEPGGGDLEYVDLRWKDRIAVMPANGGR